MQIQPSKSIQINCTSHLQLNMWFFYLKKYVHDTEATYEVEKLFIIIQNAGKLSVRREWPEYHVPEELKSMWLAIALCER